MNNLGKAQDLLQKIEDGTIPPKKVGLAQVFVLLHLSLALQEEQRKEGADEAEP